MVGRSLSHRAEVGAAARIEDAHPTMPSMSKREGSQAGAGLVPKLQLGNQLPTQSDSNSIKRNYYLIAFTPILSGLSRPKPADQFQRLGGRTLFDPTIFTAVSSPAHHAVIAKPPPQQGVVPEKVIVV
jgi:hypothetical protein